MLTAIALALVVATGVCNSNAQALGLCSVENTGTSIEIGGTRPGGGEETEGGNDNSGRGGGGRDQGGSGGGSASRPYGTAADCIPGQLCRPGNYTVEVIRPTLTDVASFAPQSLALADEPDGVGIVSMPMNFVVAPTVHEQAGELFGVPITVRFTPASVVFVHGDGTSRTSSDGGSTWAQLGLPQFSATATSHAYTARGTYSAHALVRYVAEFNLGNGWSPIDGVLEIPTGSTDVRILEVRTALVEQTCIENPSGPGC